MDKFVSTMQNLGGLWDGFNVNLSQTSNAISQTKLPTVQTNSVFRADYGQIVLIAGIVVASLLFFRKLKRKK